MKQFKYLFIILVLICSNISHVSAREFTDYTHDLTYDITSLNIGEDGITFEGWAFIDHLDNVGGKNLVISITAADGTDFNISKAYTKENKNYSEIDLYSSRYAVDERTTSYDKEQIEQIKWENGVANEFYDYKCIEGVTDEYAAKISGVSKYNLKGLSGGSTCLYYKVGFNITFKYSELAEKIGLNQDVTFYLNARLTKFATDNTNITEGKYPNAKDWSNPYESSIQKIQWPNNDEYWLSTQLQAYKNVLHGYKKRFNSGAYSIEFSNNGGVNNDKFIVTYNTPQPLKYTVDSGNEGKYGIANINKMSLENYTLDPENDNINNPSGNSPTNTLANFCKWQRNKSSDFQVSNRSDLYAFQIAGYTSADDSSRSYKSYIGNKKSYQYATYTLKASKGTAGRYLYNKDSGRKGSTIICPGDAGEIVASSAWGHLTGDSYLTFKIKERKVCKSKSKLSNLKCENPEEKYTIETYNDDGSKDCDQVFATEGGSAIARFTQTGLLKIGLHNTYIKSGQAFSIDATYTDTITWKIVDMYGNDGDYNYSDDINTEEERKKVRNEIKKQILKYYTESELQDISKNNPNPFIFYGKNGKATKLPGEWKITKSKTNNQFISDDYSGTVTFTAKYQLKNVYTNSNKITNSGVATTTNPANSSYVKRGRLFYTDLTLPTGYYKIKGTINGLSGLKYKKYKINKNGYIWSATYECGINCYQDYYNYDNDTETNSDKASGYKFTYREISEDVPFPQKAGSTNPTDLIGIGSNWWNWAERIGAQDSSNANTTTKKIKGLDKIKERIKNSKNKNNLEYVISIDNVNKVKLYNIGKNYINTSFNNKGYSKFLDTSNVDTSRTRNLTMSKIGSCDPGNGKQELNGNCFCVVTDLNGKCLYDGGAGQ